MVVDLKRINAGKFLATVEDVGALVATAIYFLYVTFLLYFDLGTTWLNYAMLIITILYFTFFITKLLTANKILHIIKNERLTKYILRYTKWGMKIINALFVAFSVLAAREHGGEEVLMLVGVMIVIITFTVSILWDLFWHFIRRRFREIWQDWDKLTREEKNQRVETIIVSVVETIDSIAGIDIKEDILRKRLDTKEKGHRHEI